MDIVETQGPSAAVEAVLAQEQRRLEAMRAGDTASLETLLHANLRYVMSSGKVETREGLVGQLADGSLRYGDELDIHEVTLLASDDLAALTGTLHIHVKGEPTDFHGENRFTMVWQREDDAWSMVSWQSTSMPSGD